ncbi:MAG: hypothetical protein U1F68_21045 [Gammaproteobacteria bacterium]
MKPSEVVATLKARGIDLEALPDGRLNIIGADRINDADMATLRAHKAELLAHLADAKPTAECPTCGDAVFWQAKGSPWRCITCHPTPPKGARWFTLPSVPVRDNPQDDQVTIKYPSTKAEPPEPSGPCPACNWSSFWLDTEAGTWKCGRCRPRPSEFMGSTLTVEHGDTHDSVAEAKAEREAIQALNDDLCAKRTSDRPETANSPAEYPQPAQSFLPAVAEPPAREGELLRGSASGASTLLLQAAAALFLTECHERRVTDRTGFLRWFVDEHNRRHPHDSISADELLGALREMHAESVERDAELSRFQGDRHGD